jgi:signal transduction histidine kinase
MRGRRGNGYHRVMEDTRLDPEPSTVRPAPLSAVYDAVSAVALLLFVWAGMWVPDVLFVAGRRFPRGVFPLQHVTVTPPIAFVLAAVCILPLALRRRFPVGVLVTISAGVALYQLASFPPSMVIVGLLIALYSAGTMLERRPFVIWALACGAVVVISGLPVWGSPLFWAELVRSTALLAVAAALGDATRNRRAYIVEVVQRASEAERTREEEARRRVDEERLRIARELHDVTAHSLSIVAVQSGVALHVLDTDPEAARSALVAIRETSRGSLQELRAMLGVLRASGDTREGVPLAPTPGLARIEDLVRPLRDAGLSVDVAAPEGGEPLAAMVDASAYRIIQEALTNVLRHAGPAHVVVTIARDEEELLLEVVDDGPAARTSPSAEGHGIAGMRERALALGGTFSVGPRPEGGWRVAATLPLTVRSA